jgi:hypothetical protein
MQKMVEETSPVEAGYEHKDVNVKSLLIWTVIIVAFLVACLAFVDDIFMRNKEELFYKIVLKPESTQLRDLRAGETEILTSYKVIDPQKGVYRVPIARAMELMSEEAFRGQQGNGVVK